LFSTHAQAGEPSPAQQQETVQAADNAAVVAAAPVERVSVLVYMDPGLQRGAVQREEVKAFTAGKGAYVKYEYKAVMRNVMNLRDVPVAALSALEKMPGVLKVEESRYHENVLSLHDSTPLIRGLQSQINGAGLSATGAGIRVCVVDTGIDSNHIMYTSRIDTAAGRDFVNDDNDPEDDNGHGSHVAGIAVGRTGLTVDFGCVGPEPFQGVAPEATLIGVKVINQFGGGTDADIIAGIDYCADQTASGGRADVMNLSIGDPGAIQSGVCDSHSWSVAANDAVDAGVTVVVATGNECMSNAFRPPACASKTIAVGSTWDESFPNCENGTRNFNWSCCRDRKPKVDDLVCTSNQGTEMDVVAPGCDIYSADYSDGAGVGVSIINMCGTSMASPHVAGLAALILDVDPSLTPAGVRQVIRDGAIDFGPAGFDTGYGYGRIDVINSLSLLQCGDGTCDPEEDQCSCPEDCGTPPPNEIPNSTCQDGIDNDCNDGADCDDPDCETDPACVNPCDDDGVCEPGEDCHNCSSDCDSKLNGRPSGRYCCGNGILEGPEGDGRCDGNP
jgi:subtilisin family serine protease